MLKIPNKCEIANIALKTILKPLDERKCICSTFVCFFCDNSFCSISISFKQFSQFYIGCEKGKKKATILIAAYMKFENKIKTYQRTDEGL